MHVLEDDRPSNYQDAVISTCISFVISFNSRYVRFPNTFAAGRKMTDLLLFLKQMIQKSGKGGNRSLFRVFDLTLEEFLNTWNFHSLMLSKYWSSSCRKGKYSLHVFLSIMKHTNCCSISISWKLINYNQ